jgi:hypothetical protein
LRKTDLPLKVSMKIFHAEISALASLFNLILWKGLETLSVKINKSA